MSKPTVPVAEVVSQWTMVVMSESSTRRGKLDLQRDNVGQRLDVS